MRFWVRGFPATAATEVAGCSGVQVHAVEVADSVRKLLRNIESPTSTRLRLITIYDRSRTIVDRAKECNQL